MSFSPANLVARCYVRKVKEQWIGVCIDFDLVSQADTFEEARSKLVDQVKSYVIEAVTIDREHARELLTRKAPFLERARFRFYLIKAKLQNARKPQMAFDQTLPLTPAH